MGRPGRFSAQWSDVCPGQEKVTEEMGGLCPAVGNTKEKKENADLAEKSDIDIEQDTIVNCKVPIEILPNIRSKIASLLNFIHLHR